MNRLFIFPTTLRLDPEVEAWLDGHTDELGAFARRWYQVMRDCGEDVREVLHDGCPTACVLEAAFGYVNAFKDHVNLGFFHGAELSDPDGLLEGTGKYMRHVKLRPDEAIDEVALKRLIESAYLDMQARVETEASDCE